MFYKLVLWNLLLNLGLIYADVDTDLIYQDANYLIYDFKTNDGDEFRYISPNDGQHLMHGMISVKDASRIKMEYMGMILASLLIEPQPSKLLLIGMGIGILPRTFHNILPKSQIDVVEIDKYIYDLAVEYFYFKTDYSNVNVFIQDGYDYVMKLDETNKYDLIIFDAFTNGYCSPQVFTTQMFLNKIKQQLTKNGILVINTLVECIFHVENLNLIQETFNNLYISEVLVSNKVILAGEYFPPFKKIEEMSKKYKWLFSTIGVNSLKLIEVFHFDKKPHQGACFSRRTNIFLLMCTLNDNKF